MTPGLTNKSLQQFENTDSNRIPDSELSYVGLVHQLARGPFEMQVIAMFSQINCIFEGLNMLKNLKIEVESHVFHWFYPSL